MRCLDKYLFRNRIQTSNLLVFCFFRMPQPQGERKKFTPKQLIQQIDKKQNYNVLNS